MGPQDYDPTLINHLRQAMDALRTAFKTGNIAKVRAAQASVETLRAAAGYGPLPWLSDFEIVAENAQNAAGELARFIASERQAVAETGQGSMVGSPLPWYDTVDAFEALNAYEF
jgi:hypothetical protein